MNWNGTEVILRQNKLEGEEDSNRMTMGTGTRESMNSNDNNNNAGGCQREAERILGIVATRLTGERDSEVKEMHNNVIKGGK